jgi:hypothetical protein
MFLYGIAYSVVLFLPSAISLYDAFLFISKNYVLTF